MTLSTLIELLKNAPALVVMAAIVWMFISKLGEISNRSHEVHDRTVDALISTKETIGDNTRVLKDTKKVIEDHSRELEIRRRMREGDWEQ